MPLPVELIDKDTPVGKVRQLISATIQKLIDEEKKSPKEAAGQAYSMAEEKWGKSIPKIR